jgi:DNA-binding transcriptional LysR family regulator
MNIRFLETFVWVARLRSFRLAAERVHTTQAAVSQRIAALERDLGVRLLDRSRRDVQLTPEGTFVLERSEAIVQLYGETRRRASGAKALKSTIRLGVTDIVSLSFLPNLYRLLIDEYGVETVQTKVDLPITHYQALKHGDIDVAIGPATSQAQELVHVGLCGFEMRWVASPRLAAVPLPSLRLADLLAHPIISHSRASLPHRLIEEQLHAAGLRGFKLHSASTLAGVIQLVAGGVGVSAVPATLVLDQVAQGTIRLLPIEEPFPEVQISVSYLHAPEDNTSRVLVQVIQRAVKMYCQQVRGCYVHLV